MTETCAYCINHVWHDMNEHHVCAKTLEEKGFEETCPSWRRMVRLFGADKKA